jgi:hypothetical protein
MTYATKADAQASLATVQTDLIPRNPCLIKGVSASRAAERPTATPAEVTRFADAFPPRYSAEPPGHS